MKTYRLNINGKKKFIEINFIKKQISDHPDWHRTRLSQELCKIWGWVSPLGQLKDISCRKLLLKLERQNHFELPKLRRTSPNALRNQRIPKIEHSTKLIQTDLKYVTPIQVTRVAERTDESKLFNSLLFEYHYLSFRNPIGANIKYLIKSADSQPLACLLFASAAWKTAARDQSIGWNSDIRELNLRFIANNTRFLILPWIKIPNLATHILSRVIKEIQKDWLEKYGHSLFLLETFVDQKRFLGTCYQAGNWINIGQTTGRTREDKHHNITAPIKSVWIYPLTTHFREKLNLGY